MSIGVRYRTLFCARRKSLSDRSALSDGMAQIGLSDVRVGRWREDYRT